MPLLQAHTQSCPSLWDPLDCGPPGSSDNWISQAKYWRGLPLPPPGDLPDPVNIEPESPASSAPKADSLLNEPSGKYVSPIKAFNSAFSKHHFYQN